MNIPMYNGDVEILVHPDKVSWMEQAGWAVEKQSEEQNENEVIENGSDNRA